jgi:HK97 family phage prohead protease
MEHKQTEPIILNTDDSQGIVEAIWAVMGNVDGGNDVIHPGAFTKTFSERSQQVKLLDNHRTDSVMSALGTVLELRELGKGELPASLTQRYPDASGGAWGRFQFLLDTPEGKGAFTRIQHGAVKEWSFGYDTTKRDHDSIERDGRKVTVRNLRELKLYEVSPVLFPMNEATITTGVKSDSKEIVNGRPVRRLGDVLQGTIHKVFTSMVDEWYIQGYMDREQRIAISSLIGESLDILANGIPAEIADLAPQGYGYYYDCMSKVMVSEIKAGRVLSARNATRIQSALDALKETLTEAFGEEEESEGDKNGATEPQKSNALTPEEEAEPQPDESTRQLIELELEKLKLLEV